MTLLFQLQHANWRSCLLEDYKPHVIEHLRYKYAKMIISEKDLENLDWALKFINDYERKHK